MPASVAGLTGLSASKKCRTTPMRNPFTPFADVGDEVGDRTIGAGRIGGIVTGHRLEQQRAVLDGPGQRAGVVHAE